MMSYERSKALKNHFHNEIEREQFSTTNDADEEK